MLLSAPASLPLLLSAVPTALPPPCHFAAATLIAAEVPGAQPQDFFYILGVGAVAAFGIRQFYDSWFPENNEYVPPIPGAMPGPLKNILGGSDADPAVEAERLRQELLAAAEAGDLKTAYRLEKELKNYLAETGMRLVVDDEFQRSEDVEALPDRW
jgi:hypothetical protein